MTLWRPTRREIIQGAPLALGSALAPARAFASVSKPLRFLAIGDWGRQGRADQRAVAQLAARVYREAQCDFVVSTGDNFYIWGVPSGALTPWRTSYENVYCPALKQNWFSVLGNHDYSGSIGAQIAYRSPGWQGDRKQPPPWGWRMDNRWWELRLTAFGRPDVHLFFIDTVTWRGEEDFPHDLLGDDILPGYPDAQCAWLAEGLRSSGARIKIVIGHHPIYSVGPHGGAMKLASLDEILRSGGATAYINGHDHCLYHIETSSMDYICSGAGSEVLTGYTGAGGDCVLSDLCSGPATPIREVPRLRSYFAKGGIGLFSLNSTSVDFQFRTVAGTCSPSRRIAIRS